MVGCCFGVSVAGGIISGGGGCGMVYLTDIVVLGYYLFPYLQLIHACFFPIALEFLC